MNVLLYSFSAHYQEGLHISDENSSCVDDLCFQTKTYEFLVKFKVEMEQGDSSSVASVAGGVSLLEEREKKKFIRVTSISLNYI